MNKGALWNTIQQAVPIVIHEASTSAPPATTHSRFCCDVGERAISIVPVQGIPAQVGDEQVGVAIVVIVSCGHSHPVRRTMHTGIFCDIGECAVPVIVIQAVPKAIGLVGDAPLGIGSSSLAPLKKNRSW